jgi:tetratricopeptide (TPR) repeat protein
MKPMAYLLLKYRAIANLVFGRSATAESIFNQMLERWPDDVYALSSRSHLHAQAGRPALALQDSARLTALDPGNGRVWFNHGFLLEEAGQWDEALTAFQRATELAPQLDRAWYGLGLVLIRLGRHDEAIAALKRNTELQPMSPYGWYQLARVHADRQEPEAVVKIIRHLKGFEPKVAEQLERETGLHAGASAG